VDPYTCFSFLPAVIPNPESSRYELLYALFRDFDPLNQLSPFFCGSLIRIPFFFCWLSRGPELSRFRAPPRSRLLTLSFLRFLLFSLELDVHWSATTPNPISTLLPCCERGSFFHCFFELSDAEFLFQRSILVLSSPSRCNRSSCKDPSPGSSGSSPNPFFNSVPSTPAMSTAALRHFSSGLTLPYTTPPSRPPAPKNFFLSPLTCAFFFV